MRTTEEVINLIAVNREWLSFIPCQWSFLDKAPSIRKKNENKKKVFQRNFSYFFHFQRWIVYAMHAFSYGFVVMQLEKFFFSLLFIY